MLKTILEGNNRGKKARVIKYLQKEIFNDNQNITDIANWEHAGACKGNKSICVEYKLEFDNLGYMTIRIDEEYNGKMTVKYQDVVRRDLTTRDELYKRQKEEYQANKSTLKEISEWK